jgi:hypothetical protein
MKYLYKIVLFILLLNFFLRTKADVIYSPSTETGAVLSLEGIVSYEIAFTSMNSFNLWGGGGFVFPANNFIHPAYGTEAALEFRHYFSRETFRKFNLGLYAGLAYMSIPEMYNGRVVRRKPSAGFVPGIKLTYKHPVAEKLVAEPYISLSLPFYDESFNNLFSDNRDKGVTVTLGVRIGFNHVLNLVKNQSGIRV